MTRIAIAVGLLGVGLCTTGCKSKDAGGTGDDEARAAGCELFKTNCASCHGDGARGDGPHGEHLDPLPTDLLSQESRQRTHHERMADVRDGVGDGMPAFASLLSDDEMEWTLVHVDGLAAGNAAECDDVASDATSPTSGNSSSSGGGSMSTSTTGGPPVTDTGTPETTDATTSGDTTGAGESGGVSPACEAWCGCLELNCTEFPGYPFASVDECHTTCADLSTEEITCWQGFCEEVADNPALADHLCDHAWGALGLNEC